MRKWVLGEAADQGLAKEGVLGWRALQPVQETMSGFVVLRLRRGLACGLQDLNKDSERQFMESWKSIYGRKLRLPCEKAI